jgi:hypothetical protein
MSQNKNIPLKYFLRLISLKYDLVKKYEKEHPTSLKRIKIKSR